MTEADWDRCDDPRAMLDFLRTSGMASDRKLRLFACACCRGIWDVLHDERSREAVAVSERYADGRADLDELESAFAAALHACEANFLRASKAAWLAAHPLTRGLADSAAGAAALEAKLRPRRRDEQETGEEGQQAELLRDIFGPVPLRGVRIALAWLAWNDGTVKRLAEGAYEQRAMPAGTLDNSRLAVLADALEEAGCADEELLGHLRGPGPHVRGCWPIDLLLGKI